MVKPLTEILESVRRGEPCELTFAQNEALMVWLSNPFRQEETQQTAPGYDPVLVLLVLQQLERSLFKHGHLDLETARLGQEQSFNLRRKRFRRLASVFHPDRFPELADWLTPRSQAIHHAYARFKQRPDAWPEYKHPTDTSAAPETVSPVPAQQPQRKASVHNWLLGLRARFGHDRRLAHKLVGVLALIAALPVANLYLAPASPQSAPKSTASASSDGPAEAHTAMKDETPSVNTYTNIEAAPLATVSPDSDDDDPGLPQPKAMKAKLAITDPAEAPDSKAIVAEEHTFGHSIDEPLIVLGPQDNRQVFRKPAPERDISVQEHHGVRPVHSARLTEHAPVLVSSILQTDPIAFSETASVAFTQSPQNTIQYNNYETAALLQEGELVLGPLKRHPVGHLLTEYQSHVQSGNVNTLMQLFTSTNPRQDQQNGHAAIAAYYRTLFRSSSQRTVHLKVLRMQRDGDGWQVETALDFSIASADGKEQIMNGRTHFRIQPDRGILKIAAIEN